MLGANDCLTGEDVRKIESLIKTTSVLICQLEVPIPTNLEALKLGRQHGGIVCVHYIMYSSIITVTTILNAAPATSSPDIRALYQYTDLLCVNEIEVIILHVNVLWLYYSVGRDVTWMQSSQGHRYSQTSCYTVLFKLFYAQVCYDHPGGRGACVRN